MKSKKTFQNINLSILIIPIVICLLIALVFFSTVSERCDIPDYELYALLRCGNPITNWLYDFQSLIAGIFASFAAIFTIHEMRKNTKIMSDIANRDYYRAIDRSHDMVLENCDEIESIINRFKDAVMPFGLLINANRLRASLEDLVCTLERIEDRNWDIEFSFPLRSIKREMKGNIRWLEDLTFKNKGKGVDLTMDDLPLFHEKIQPIKLAADVLRSNVLNSRASFYKRMNLKLN